MSTITAGEAGAPPSGRTAGPAGLAIALLGMFAGTQAADPIVATNALVKASRTLDMSSSVMTLAASISTLVLAATVMSTGLLADRLGRRRALIGALLLSAVGDLIAALAPTSSIFLLGRAIAGLGLGAVFCAAFAYLSVVTTPQTLAKAVGQFSAVGSLTMIAWSLIGGELAGVQWRLAFLLVPAACLLGALATPKVLPKVNPIPARGNDVLAQVLLALGVILFLYGASHAVKGFTRPDTLIGVLGGIALVGAFAVVEAKRGDKAFFPIAIVKSPLFLGAVVAGFIYNFGLALTLLQLSNIWQYVNHLGNSAVSLGQMPYFVTGIITALVVGRLISGGLKTKWVLLGAGAIGGLGMISLIAIDERSSYTDYLPALILIGAGTTAAAIPYGSLVLEAIGERFKDWFGPVTSSRATVGQFAYALGMSFSMVMVDRVTDGGVVRRLEAAGVSPSLTGQGLDQLAGFVQTGQDPSTELGRRTLAVAAPSYVDAFTTTMAAGGAISIVFGVLGWWVLRRDPAGRPGSTGPA